MPGGGRRGNSPNQWGGHKLNIYVVGAMTMSEALVEEAGKLLDHIAKE